MVATRDRLSFDALRAALAAAVVGAAALSSSTPAAGQEREALPASSVAEQISVELVNVDVRVVDNDGHRVEGLPRAAFRLFEDGNPVEITHFAWVPQEAPGAGFSDARREAATDGDPGAGGPRQFAIFFDELQIGDQSRGPLLSALYRSLSTRLAPDDRVSVIRFDGADLDLLLPWSTDRKRLAKAFEELGGFSARRMTAGLELRSWLRLLEQDIKGGMGRRGEGGCPDAGVILRSYADLVRRNVEFSASALLRYATRLSHEPGQRILLHVSDGIPLVAGGEAYQYAIDMCSGEALAQGVPGAFSVMFDGDQEGARDRFDPFKARLEMNEYVMASLWTDVTARINALGVTVYALQGAESGTQFLPDSELGVIPPAARAMAQQNPVDTIALLARETGGLLARGGRGIEEEVNRLVADLGGYYSLAFQPAPGSKPGLRRLKVELDRPGLDVRHRQSYRLESRDERISTQLAELFEADRVENPLALSLALRTVDGAADPSAPRRLQLVVPFERLALVPSPAGGDEGQFTVFVLLRREGGRLLAPRQRSIVARRTDPKAMAFTYEIALPDEPGEVAVAVVDNYSGTVAFARERLRGN